MGEGELLLLTNFSAQMDLRASETDNCSVDGHAVLDIFVAKYSRRVVLVDDKDGETHEHIIVECEVWYIVGDTYSKGKK